MAPPPRKLIGDATDGGSSPAPVLDAPSTAASRHRPRQPQPVRTSPARALPPPAVGGSASSSAASAPACPAPIAVDSQVLSMEVQGVTKRGVPGLKQKKPPPAKRFRSPMVPMVVKSLGIKLMLSRVRSSSSKRVRAHGRTMVQPMSELMDDITAEILLRLPPDDPSCLFRAALVCKPWLRILCDPAFLRRYRTFHRTPPMLGFLHRLHIFQGDPEPQFSPTVAVPTFPHTASRCRRPRPLDCRHGRVFIDMLDSETENFLFWDPVTGYQLRISEPDILYFTYSAAVICATVSCDHLDCHGGPFHVALVASDHSKDLIWASVYSSETRSWSTPTSLDNGKVFYVNAMRGAPIGDEIYFTLKHGEGIAKYDWGKNCLSVVNPPPPEHYGGLVALMVMEDSSLGYAGIAGSSLYLWLRKVNAERAAEWVQYRVIKLETVMQMAQPCDGACVVGFAEGVSVIFVNTGVGLFTIELKSGQVRKVDEPRACYSILPYMSFYTPGHGGLSSPARTN